MCTQFTPPLYNISILTKLNFRISKNEKSPSWVVLLHGLFGSLSNLSATEKALAASHSVISFDLPDHGESNFTRSFSFEDYSRAIENQLDALSINQYHLLGHSLGGKVAMMMAFLFPDSVEKLIVADISPAAYLPRHQNVFNGLSAVNLTQTQDRNHANQQLAQHIETPSVRQFLLKSLYRDNQGWKWRFNLPLLKRDYAVLSSALPQDRQFNKPTLFIKGAESDYLTSEHSEMIQRMFPSSQAKIISGTGHWLHAEKPAVFNRIANQFLQAK